MIKRTNETNQGVTTKSIGRGQTLQTPTGKDSSDYSGPAAKEITSKLKMGGGQHDYSKALGKSGD